LKILAFETSSIACSVALQNGQQTEMLHEIAISKQGRLILPMIQALLERHALKLNQLDAIAYGCGPGSFTGIRIASSIVQGLGFVSQLPIIPISSLAALALSIFMEKHCDKLLVAVNAHAEQVYWATYLIKNGYAELVGQELACRPEDTQKPVISEENDWVGVGDGWEKYREKLLHHQLSSIYSQHFPTAEAVLELAKAKLQHNDWVRPKDAIPVYLTRGISAAKDNF